MKRFKWIVAVVLLIVFFGGLVEIGVLNFYGERQLSQAFIEEFDLSKLDPLAVFDYLEKNGGYHILSHWGVKEDACRFNMPPEPQCWVNEVILSGNYVVREPSYELRWFFQLPPEENTSGNVYFKQSSKSLFIGNVHIVMTGGTVDAFVCGNSIQKCQEVVEEKLLDLYRELVINGATD